MPINLETCIEPHLDSFTASLAVADYKAPTIKNYRSIIRKLGQVMEVEGVTPSTLTLDQAERLGRMVSRKHGQTVQPYNLARRFAQHLIDEPDRIGVAQPAPLTEAQVTRAALLASFETYLVKQRGLSQRTIYHTLRFANRFLDYRFGEQMIDPACLRPADAIGFIEHVLAGARRDKTIATHVRIFLQYLFGCGATPTNLALSLPRTAKSWGARLPRHLSPEGVELVLASVRDNPRHGARDYLPERDRLVGHPATPLFVTEKATRLSDCSARYNFARACQQIGLRTHQPYCKHGRGPRIHDLRHSFAVKTMLGWYRTGKDPAREMIRLTTYLGHSNPSNTYWYLEAVPELLDLAMARASDDGREAVQ